MRVWNVLMAAEKVIRAEGLYQQRTGQKILVDLAGNGTEREWQDGEVIDWSIPLRVTEEGLEKMGWEWEEYEELKNVLRRVERAWEELRWEMQGDESVYNMIEKMLRRVKRRIRDFEFYMGVCFEEGWVDPTIGEREDMDLTLYNYQGVFDPITINSTKIDCYAPHSSTTSRNPVVSNSNDTYRLGRQGLNRNRTGRRKRRWPAEAEAIVKMENVDGAVRRGTKRRG